MCGSDSYTTDRCRCLAAALEICSLLEVDKSASMEICSFLFPSFAISFLSFVRFLSVPCPWKSPPKIQLGGVGRETCLGDVGNLSPHGHVGVHVDTKIPHGSDRRYGDLANANRLSGDQVLTP